MPKGGTSTKHHCPGDHTWIGDISPGGCSEMRQGKLIFCKKHQMPCRNGCGSDFHCKNEEGCKACVRRWNAVAQRERRAVEAAKEAEKSKVDDAFWNPGKDRKKPKEAQKSKDVDASLEPGKDRKKLKH